MICTKCGVGTEFYGKARHCKGCMDAYAVEYRKNNLEKCQEHSRRHIKKRMAADRLAYMKKHREYQRAYRARKKLSLHPVSE